MRQNKDGQPVSLFEVVELYHQPSRRIAFLHGAAQVGKIVHNEDFTAGLQCHLLHAADDGFLEIVFQQRIRVKRYPVQPVGKGIELSVLARVAELELLFGQFEVQIQHIVSPSDTVGYLHGKDRLAHIGIRKDAGQLPLIPKTVPQRTGRG